MDLPVYHLPKLNVGDYRLFIADEARANPKLSVEADAIISYLVEHDAIRDSNTLVKICHDAVASIYGVSADAVTFKEGHITNVVDWLISAGIIKELVAMSERNLVLQSGFRQWLTDCGSIAHRVDDSVAEMRLQAGPNDPGIRYRTPQHSSYPAFDELADVAMMDPRLRDILEDIRHIGAKANRALSGN